MKTLRNLLLAIVVIFSITSCNKDEENTGTTVATDEAAEIVASSLAEDAEGFTQMVEDAAMAADELDGASGGRIAGESTSCGFDTTATFTRTNPAGTLVTYDYSFVYNYALTCNEYSIPQSMSFEFQQQGNVDAPRFASNDTRSGSWELSGLEIAESEYIFNGNYKRQGSQSSKVRNKNAYTLSFEKSMTNLTVNKSTYEITGGTSSFTLSGTATTGGYFNFSGTIQYLGNGQVTVTISGESYIVHLDDGTIEE